MTMNETLTMLAMMLAPAFFSLLGIGLFGSPVVAVLGELAARTKRRVFYAKYGQQTGAMGLILLALFIGIEAIGIGVLYTKYPQLIDKYILPLSNHTVLLAVLGTAMLFTLLYFLLWNSMRNNQGLHLVTGFIASGSAMASVVLAVSAKLMLFMPTEMAQEQMALGIRSMILPMAAMYAILAVSTAAGLSCAYLVMRRNKDDFGRDYYKFSLPLAARWSALPMFAFLACQGWLYMVLPPTYKTMVTGTPLGLVWAGGTLLSGICALIWIIVARSEKPMQLKGLTFLALVILWLAYAMNATLFINFLSMF